MPSIPSLLVAASQSSQSSQAGFHSRTQLPTYATNKTHINNSGYPGRCLFCSFINDLAVGPVPLPCILHAHQLAIYLVTISRSSSLRSPTSSFPSLSRFKDEYNYTLLLPLYAVLYNLGAHFGMGSSGLDSSVSSRPKSLDTALCSEELLLLCKSDNRLEDQS